MKKTNQIFNKLFKLLEQTPVPGNMGVDQQPASTNFPAQPTNPKDEVSENKKYILKILTNAFIFNPKSFKSESMRSRIAAKIKEIESMETAAPAQVISKILKIIDMDPTLKIESKTLNLLKNYMLFIEQPQNDSISNDATDLPVSDDLDAETTEDRDTLNLNLAEIFPLYKSLIIKALKHSPTEDELMILEPVINSLHNTDPEAIKETIQKILKQAKKDADLKNKLNKA
jgi:hypothetical protein